MIIDGHLLSASRDVSLSPHSTQDIKRHMMLATAHMLSCTLH